MPSSLNEFPILSGTVRRTRQGAWTAELEIKADEPYQGPAILTIEGQVLSGTILEDGASRKGVGRIAVSVVGGAGGLDTEVPARQYVAPSVSTVLSDICKLAGETMSGAIETSLLGQALVTWQRASGKAREAIGALAESIKVSWRILDDGTVWLGAETWPTAAPECRVLDDDQGTGTITTSLVPTVAPGQTFQGRRIEFVTHVLDPKASRTEASTTSPAALMSAALGPLEKRILYSRSYRARVTKQNPDGTLQVLPDHASFKGAGLDRVAIRLGVPGTATVPVGAIVMLEFDEGDPQKPIARCFGSADLTELKLGNGADYVALAAKVDAQFAKLTNMFASWVVVLNDGGGALKTLSGSLSFDSVAADKTKAE